RCPAGRARRRRDALRARPRAARRPLRRDRDARNRGPRGPRPAGGTPRARRRRRAGRARDRRSRRAGGRRRRARLAGRAPLVRRPRAALPALAAPPPPLPARLPGRRLRAAAAEPARPASRPLLGTAGLRADRADEAAAPLGRLAVAANA